MNTQYRFHLYVETPQRKQYREVFTVDALQSLPMPFRPIDRCSDPMTAMMASGYTSSMAARIDTERKQLAQQIAAQLTEGILDAIKAQDTHNGYPQ